MKKVLLGLVLGGLMAATASAAPFAVSMGFGGVLSASPSSIILANGQSTVLFPSLTFSNFTALCSLASFCNGGVTTSDGTFSSGDGQVFTFNAGKTYTVTSPWSVQDAGGGVFKIFTTGIYADGSGTTQAGVLNFTTQVPSSRDDQGNILYGFSASGSTVPEPASMALLGSGLLGLGFIARRRSVRK